MKILKKATLIYFLFLNISTFAQWNKPIQSTYNKKLDLFYVTNSSLVLSYNLGTKKIDTLISGLNKPNSIIYRTFSFGERILVLDSNVIKSFDINGNYKKTINIPNAKELNDIDYDSISKYLYVSDKDREYIYKISFGSSPLYTPKIENWLTSGIKKPHGLFFNNKDKHLYVTSMDFGIGIQKVHSTIRAITSIVPSFKGPIFDIAGDQQNNYYISSWNDNYLYQFQDTFKNHRKMYLMDKPSGIIFINKLDKIIIPSQNTDSIYQIKLHNFKPIVLKPECLNNYFTLKNDTSRISWGTFDKRNKFSMEWIRIDSPTDSTIIEIDSMNTDKVPDSMSAQIKTNYYDLSGLYRLRWKSNYPLIYSDEVIQIIKSSPLPGYSMAFITKKAHVCIDDSIKLGTSNNSKYTYLWSPTLNTSAIQTIKPIQNKKHYLTTRDTATQCFHLDSVNIKVITKPDFSAVNKNNQLCYRTFGYIGSENIGTYKYTWSPKKFISDSTISKPLFKGDHDISYQLTIQAGSCVASDSIHIIVNRVEILPKHIDTIFKCKNENKFIVQVPSGNTWTPQTIDMFVENNKLYSKNNFSLKALILCQSNTNGCREVDTINIEVYPAHTKPILVFNSLTNELSANQNHKKYVWYLNNNPIDTTNINKIIIKQSGSYKVEVFDKNNCSSVSDIKIIQKTGINSIKNNPIVFPNPASKSFRVNSTFDIKQLKIYSLEGKLLISKQNITSKNNVNIQKLKPGCYTLQLIFSNGSASHIKLFRIELF